MNRGCVYIRLLLMSRKIDPENSLLFFDEVQEISRALTALKHFYEMILSIFLQRLL